MIIIRISEGLGNQMFQYALGRMLSEKHHTSLIMDVSFYNHQSPGRSQRKFLLDQFTITAQIAEPSDFQKAGLPDTTQYGVYARFTRKLFRLLELRKPIKKKRIILEPNFRFIPDILETSDNIFLSGVWQSEKYFSAIKPIIQKEFSLKKPLSNRAQDFKRIIDADQCSVSLHIRRGDYVTGLQSSTFHGLCSLEYYKEAIAYIAKDNPQLSLFVFSDDIDWIKSHLQTQFPTTYVSDGHIPDYEELHLMSLCKHHIIANSSFSWWGAWLGTRENSLTIAPQAWFTSQTIDTKDLIPTSWITL
jgi:hypothetical protein